MPTTKQRLKRILATPQSTPPPKHPSSVDRYIAGGRVPFSDGYSAYREELLRTTLADETLMEKFRRGESLDAGYGTRLDERVVEYPWVMSRLEPRSTYLLDAGATLIFPFLLQQPVLQPKTIVVYTLAPEKWVHHRPNVSYIYGDLRDTILKDGVFQEIVCISTLDHIGMDNTQIYSDDIRFREEKPREYRRVIQELQRLLAPGGRLFVTVPYGRYENIGWMQQFDANELQELIASFDGRVTDQSFYKYNATGWQRATAHECAGSEYFDIHTTREIQADGAAAARAVACLEFTRE